MSSEDLDWLTYKVVVNAEEQYSIWPGDRENPLGWSDVFRGTKRECLAYIEQLSKERQPSPPQKRIQDDRPG